MEPKAKTIIERHGFKDGDRKNPKHDEIQIWVYKNFRAIVSEVFPTLKIDGSITLDLRLEYPIVDHGFSKSYVVGFVDVYSNALYIAVEVKTEIPCIGDLIRQIQFYRKYLSAARWIIVCPDDGPAPILIEQGIHFFKYPGEETLSRPPASNG